MTTKLLLLGACALGLQAQDFATAKITCLNPIDVAQPVVLRVAVTSSAFSGAHEVKTSPKNCASALLALEQTTKGWEVAGPWSNGLMNLKVDWEASLVVTGEAAEVKAAVGGLLKSVVRAR